MDRYHKVSDRQAPGPRLRAGGEVDSYCGRCKLMLEHTILAMQAGEPVQTICNTCKSQHRYRPHPPGQGPAPKRSRQKASGTWAETPKARPPKAWQEAVAGKDLSRSDPYSPQATFEAGQVIMHGKFGLGIVMGTKPGGKIIVVFEDDTRLFVHGRGQGPGSKGSEK